MKRNIDKIKSLEHEIGRYQKKVADQTKLIATMHNNLMEAMQGNQETQAAVDAVLTAVVLGFGVQAEDPDEPGKYIGWRLTVADFTVAEMREKYEIHARRDAEDGTYVLGVMQREVPHGIER